LKELTLGKSSTSESSIRFPVSTTSRAGTAQDELSVLEAGCRRKADAARWAAERLRRSREGNDVPVEDPRMDAEMVEWAERLADCFYWMTAPQAGFSADISLLDDVGGCFETVAEAVSFVGHLLKERTANQRAWEKALPLLAEAQSALRAAL